jgi:integrase
VGGRLHPLLTVALATGLRQGELLALRWADVDLERGTLAGRHTLEVVLGEGPRFSEPKSLPAYPLPYLVGALCRGCTGRRLSSS